MMIRLDRIVCGALFFVVVAAGQAHAQSAGNNDAEIAALKQQLRLSVYSAELPGQFGDAFTELLGGL
jgi:hypothetical protein